MTLITCDNVALGYGSRVVVDGLNFTVDEGDYLCIIGENGAGKSTLVKTLLGLQKPLRGKILLNGLNAGDIGYLSQQTAIQKDFPASVNEIVLSGCLARKKFLPFYSAQDKEIAATNMERLGVQSLADRSFAELSGGQQQRVLLARALCAAKKILLLDEPVAALDPEATADMYKIISQLNQDGITIIMISHDVNEAIGRAKHVLRLGKKIFYGTSEDYHA
ncbi:MAG: metal ABC transporter ATP-binding protein [Selenomonadaceae bacterium]|nr:metal ABC transporter ATP-binding protein [Selenomonadaceae bacterium]